MADNSKIVKMLALALGSTNENEQASALGKVKAYMKRDNLSVDDLFSTKVVRVNTGRSEFEEHQTTANRKLMDKIRELTDELEALKSSETIPLKQHEKLLGEERFVTAKRDAEIARLKENQTALKKDVRAKDRKITRQSATIDKLKAKASV